MVESGAHPKVQTVLAGIDEAVEDDDALTPFLEIKQQLNRYVRTTVDELNLNQC